MKLHLHQRRDISAQMYTNMHVCKGEVTGFLSILGRVGEGGASGNAKKKKKVRNEQQAFWNYL